MVKGAAVLVLALAPAACEKLATRQFADFSQAAVAARIEALRPDVESVLGDTIGPITVKVVTAKELAKVIAPELEEFRANDEGGARGAALKEQCERDAELQSMILLGMVGAKTGWVYICPENFELPADRRRDALTYRSQPSLDVVLVHEMTHVWQHHRGVLPRAIGATRDHEEQVARAAVLEGHAEFISRAVADHRGIRDAFDLHLRMITVPSSSTEDEASLHRERLFLAHFSFRYVQGLRLWDEVVAALGRPAAQERLFAHPPKSVLAVERENEYLHPSPKPAFDLDRATRLVRRYLSEKLDAPTSIVSVLPSALKISLASVGAQGRRAVEGMVRGHSINAPRLSVGLILCRSHAAARALQEASIADTRTKGKTDNKFSLSITSDESIEVGGVDAHLINVTVDFNDRPVHMWQAFFTDGLVWVEVSAHDTDRDSMLRLIPRIAALLVKPSPWTGQTTTEAIATMRASLKHDDWRIRWRAVRNLGLLLKKQPDLRRNCAKS